MSDEHEFGDLSAFQLSQHQVEQLLIDGGDDPRLVELFGPAGVAELGDMARKSGTRRRRHDVRILLLPGILGSTIGRPGSFWWRDTIWFDPISIGRGHTTKIALRARQNITALDTIPAVYAPLRLRLQWAGYQVDDHYYDWRKSIDDLGQELATRIGQLKQREPNRKICVVAHSMGGLVTRAALSHGADIHRLVMIATPNRGSFGPVQVLRAINSTVRLVAKLDPNHTAEQLTTTVFRTFPSVYQLLPHPDVFDSFDLYDLTSWPLRPVRPLRKHLEAAPDVQRRWARPEPNDDRFHLIAGCGQETVTDLRQRADETEFTYVSTTDGDGTVPLNFALLPGVPTRYVEASHSGILSFASVARAVGDLIDHGATNELAAEPPRRRSAPRTFTDTNLKKEEIFGSRQGSALAAGEQRAALESMFNTSLSGIAVQPQAIQPSAAQPAAAPVELVGGRGTKLRGVTVGRRRLHRMDVEMVQGSILNVPCRAYVIGVFENVAPSGPALALDRELNGTLTEFFSRRLFSGEVGRISVLPTGRNLLRADFVVFAGLGQFDRFREDPGSVQQFVAKNIVRTLVRSGVEELATVMMGGGSGEPIGSSLQHLMQGFVEGLLSIDDQHRFRRVILCEMDARRYQEMRERVLRLAATDLFDEMEVTLDERYYEPPDVEVTSRRPPAGRPESEEPTYLSVRIEGSAAEGDPLTDVAPPPTTLVASVLSPSGKASVFATRHELPVDDVDALLERLDPDAPVGVTDMEAFGRELAELVLPQSLRRLLEDPTIAASHWSVIHDTQASRIPWESLRIGNRFPALEHGVSRRYLAQNLSIAKWLEHRMSDEMLDILLIVNPTEDLKGTVTEASAILQALKSISKVKTTVIDGAEATRERVLARMRSGQFDVIHYAGHAFFDPLEPGRSGIVCSDGVVSGQDLVNLEQLPALIFFNACEAGRVRGGRVIGGEPATAGRSRRQAVDASRIERSVSLAEAFLRGGIAQFVGTYWPVRDDTAALFSRTFYETVSAGKTVGEGVLSARKKVAEDFKDSIDWADYIHYGNTNFQLKYGESGAEG